MSSLRQNEDDTSIGGTLGDAVSRILQFPITVSEEVFGIGSIFVPIALGVGSAIGLAVLAQFLLSFGSVAIKSAVPG
jgi:hypothetical protein